MTNERFPKLTRCYQSALIDSSRWKHVEPRVDDIVISTAYKGGTTWMQAICGALIFQSVDPPATLDELSPWIDAAFRPIDKLHMKLESMQHRRYLKTHLPLAALPYKIDVSYIVVGRDGRDVWMSMWNHWNNMKPEVIENINANPKRKGPPMPLPPDDMKSAFDDWLCKGSFPWEKDGYPFWSHHYHAATWWKYRKLNNILHVHFTDLLNDLDGQMRRIASFLKIPIDDTIWSDLVQSVTFPEMRQNAEKRAPGADVDLWKSPENFFHRGTNGQWAGVLDPKQVDGYESAIRASLEPALVRWLCHEGEFIDPKAL